MREHGYSVDAIFVLGDLADMPFEHVGMAEMEAAHEAEMSTALAALEQICPKVYYIPGNVRSRSPPPLFFHGSSASWRKR